MTELFVHRLPGLVLKGHEFRAPLDYGNPGRGHISIFAREAVESTKEKDELPWLVFFQGGPGFGAPRPAENSGWLKRALQEFRVLLLDQRGTGRSTPVTAQSLARLGDAAAQAEYLRHFRADAIVQDAEMIRRELLGDEGKWSVLGQSYGGFCVVHYLSAAPEGLREALITGGLPSLERPVEDVYRATYAIVRAKNQQYYARYPEDAALAQRIAERLANEEVCLPNGDPLSVRRFQQLGLHFGMSDGYEKVHYLLEDAFVEGTRGEEFSYGFLRGFDQSFDFDTNPIYAILHEPLYCQGRASRWAAEAVRGEFAEFNWKVGAPLYFTGEMVYPWFFDEYQGLRPLKAAAEILAADEEWPSLYDVATLRENRVPCAAAIYYDDMYVPRQFSEETAATIGRLRAWITNEFEHNGLRADGERLLGRLLALARGG
jgi:pimeloyl-ACP methyl ester carboxylesterase